MKQIFKIALFLSLLNLNLFSQEYSYKVYDNKVGFNCPGMLTLFIDSRGFIWMGGIDGITKFDGKNFINYNKSDGLSDNHVSEISETLNHNLWISTKSGIALFDGKSFLNYKISSSNDLTTDFYFQNIIETTKGTTYAFSGKGLFLLNKKNKEFIKVNQFDYNVRGAVQDKNGVLWLATINGLYTLKNNVFTKIEIDTSKIIYSLTSIAVDKTGIIWVGSTEGIIKYDGKQFEKYFTTEEAKNQIRDIFVDSDNTVFFTSDAAEIKIYKAGKFKTIDLSHIINRSTILKIIRDRAGCYWMASSAGLIKMYSKPFKKYYLSDSIKAPVISIATDKSNNLYFGTTQGLFSLSSNGELKKHVPSDKPDEIYIISLLPTDSCLIAGTYSGQVFKFTNGKFIAFGGIDYPGVNPVYQIVPHNDQELWICKGSNVVNYKDGKFTAHDFSKPSTIGTKISTFTQSALVDSKGRVWFAHATNFTKYENGKFTEMGAKHGFNYEEAATLCEDRNKNIWVGTYGYGIVKYNGKIFKNFTVKDGLISNYIASCLFDEKTNTLWIGTINGISKLTLDKNSEINAITNYNSEQGLESAECNQNSIFKLPNGNILFGTSNGLFEYNQAFNQKNLPAPQLNFTGLRLNYEDTDWSLFSDSINSWSKMPFNLTLPYNKNHLTFDFIGVNLDNNSNVKYQWQLAGFDNDWNPQNKNQSTTYSNLPFGKYLFKVRASNLDGSWSAPIFFPFKINPPIWETWWFILLIISFAIICIWLFLKYRISKIQQQEFEKTENYKKLAEVELKAMRAQMNPHFMFNTLNSIQEIVLNKDDKTARIYLADFALMMRMILENSRQKTIPLEKELEFIELYLRLEVLRFENKFNVTLIIPDSLNLNSIKIPPMLIQPYIENAIIHGLMHRTENGTLKVSFESEVIKGKEFLICTIIDNGVGRKKSAELSAWKGKKHQSMATEITNERLQLLNNINLIKGYEAKITDLENTNAESLGTKVEVYIPLN